MNLFKPQINPGLFFWSLGLGVFVFCLYRAYTLSLTHDEALSFLALQDLSLPGIMHCANTHHLNSLLMFLGSSLLGTGELVLRLPNLAALVLYLVYGARIISSTGASLPAACAGYVLLLANPFVLDFFVLARGYGLALGLTMACIYYLLESWSAGMDKPVLEMDLRCFVFAALAVLANFVFIVLYAALLTLVVLMAWTRSGSLDIRPALLHFYQKNKGSCAAVLFSFIPLTGLIWYVQAQGAFYFGGDTGFWADSVSSLLEAGLYFQDYPRVTLSLGLTGIALLYAYCALSFVSGFNRYREFTPQGLMFCLLTLSILFQLAARYILGSYYLVERTALIFVPLFMLCIIFSLGRFGSARARLSQGLLVGLALLAGLHFLLAANLSWTYSWKYDSRNKEVIQYLQAEHQGDQTIRLGANWIYLPALRYYQQSRDLDWLQLRALDSPGMFDMEKIEIQVRYYQIPARLEELTAQRLLELLKDCDYYYLARDLSPGLLEHAPGLRKIRSFPGIDASLLQDTRRLSRN